MLVKEETAKHAGAVNGEGSLQVGRREEGASRMNDQGKKSMRQECSYSNSFRHNLFKGARKCVQAEGELEGGV